MFDRKGVKDMTAVLPLREGDLSAFFGLLADIYARDPARTQLLLGQIGLFLPFLHPVLYHVDYQLFLAWEDRHPVGRVAAILDQHYPDPGVGFFGLFEVTRNQDAAEKLLRAAGNWLAGHGKTVMIGPVTFNTNQKVGTLIEGFDQPPQPGLTYNPPYYQEMLEGAGLTKEIDLLAYHWDPACVNTVKIDRVAGRARARIPGLSLRRLNGAILVRERKSLLDVYNRSLAAGWGFVPLTEREMDAFLQGLAAQSQGIYLLADVKGQPAGFSLSLPTTLTRGRAGTGFRLAVLGVVPAFRNRGLAAVLFQENIRAYARAGCHRVDISLVAENNDLMNRIIGQEAATTVARRYRVYRLPLTQSP